MMRMMRMRRSRRGTEGPREGRKGDGGRERGRAGGGEEREDGGVGRPAPLPCLCDVQRQRLLQLEGALECADAQQNVALLDELVHCRSVDVRWHRLSLSDKIWKLVSDVVLHHHLVAPVQLIMFCNGHVVELLDEAFLERYHELQDEFSLGLSCLSLLIFCFLAVRACLEMRSSLLLLLLPCVVALLFFGVKARWESSEEQRLLARHPRVVPDQSERVLAPPHCRRLISVDALMRGWRRSCDRTIDHLLHFVVLARLWNRQGPDVFDVDVAGVAHLLNQP